MDSSGDSLWIQIIVIVVLTLINAFFAASELAFVQIDQTKMRHLADEGDKKAKRVMDLLENPDAFLATIQVAITLAGFLSSASAATSFSAVLVDLLPNFAGAQTAATVIITLLLSYVTLVFGELFPKQIALQMPERIAMATSGTVAFVRVIFKPFVHLLSASTGLLQRMTPIDFSEKEEYFTRNEMKAILRRSQQGGAIDVKEFAMLEGVLSLDNMMAKDVMMPRTDTQMVDIEDDYTEILETLMNSPYTRVPLYESEKDSIIGVLHMKNVLKQAERVGFDNIDFVDVASEPMFVPSTIFIDDLLVEFKRTQQHLAILIDEYGGVEGIVTMEDILEEIVGEIEDETDVEKLGEIHKFAEDHYYIKGNLQIYKFNQHFDVELPTSEVDTIAGLIIYEIGYIPDDGEQLSIRLNGYILKTQSIEDGRIRSIEVRRDHDYNPEAEYIFKEGSSKEALSYNKKIEYDED